MEVSLPQAELINQRLAACKESLYHSEIKVLAINDALTILGMHVQDEVSRAFGQPRQYVHSDFHDQCYRSIPPALEKIQAASLYEILSIYARADIVDPVSFSQGPTRVALNSTDSVADYKREINRPFPEHLKAIVNEKTGLVLRMMEERKAPKADIKAFLKQMGNEQLIGRSQKRSQNLKR